MDELFSCVKTLVKNNDMREKIGKAAYQTISTLWNADVAGERLFNCIQAELNGQSMAEYKSGPMGKEALMR
jgi:hypothetical protein